MMYAKFAAVYDKLMADIPYDSYLEIVESALGDITNKKILDVACGTGILSVLLAEKGAIITGIDLSEEMLEIARERTKTRFPGVTFHHQAMQRMELGELFDAAIISIDSLNYLENEIDVIHTFEGIYRLLQQGGCLLFDVHSTFKTDVIFLESPFVFTSPEICYIWETNEGEDVHSVHSELVFFVKDEDGSYSRFNETHYQRTYPIWKYVEMLENSGFKIERIFADWQDEAPEDESERIFFQVRK